MAGHAGSERRSAILEKLGKKAWFVASDVGLIAELATLAEIWDGYLEDLANRPDVIGDLTVHRIVAAHFGNFAVITMFEVTRPAADKPYTYEYVSWNRGPMSGAKGLVLIETSGQISHFVVLRASRFALGAEAFDAVGGFAEVSEKGVKGMLGRFETEIKEELGAPELVVKEVHDLGRLLPDAGMTNNHPLIFAAVIDAGQADKVGSLSNPDPWELASGPTIMPMSRLRETVLANDDSYFHIVVTRLIAKGILPTSCLA